MGGFRRFFGRGLISFCLIPFLSIKYFWFKRGVPYNHLSNHSHFSTEFLGFCSRTDEKLDICLSNVFTICFCPFCLSASVVISCVIYPQIIKSLEDASFPWLPPLPSQLLRLCSDSFLALVEITSVSSL